MYQSEQNRVIELQRIIEDAQRELHHLEWTTKTQSWGTTRVKVCTMPQGHPSHCGCNW